LAAEFRSRNATDIFLLAQPQQSDDRYFGCALSGTGALAILVLLTDIDAGDHITLAGAGKSVDVPKSSPGMYDLFIDAPAAVADPAQLPEPFFVPGAWELLIPGGRNIGPFQQAVTIAPPVRLTNRESLRTIARADTTVSWNSDGYGPSDVITVSLTTGNNGANGGGGFSQLLGSGATSLFCRAPATAGLLVLPGELLRQMAATPTIPRPDSGTLQLRALPRPDRRTRFGLPLGGGGAVHALFDWSYSDTIQVAVP